jgi:F0F1-type ATP synthase delta subunit
MKYSVKMYASAFAAAAAGKLSPVEEKKIVKNFTELVRRNGDGALLPKIIGEADRLLRAKEGVRKFVIETARPLKGRLQQEVRRVVRDKDVMEEKVDPGIVAGIRVTVDEERQFDASLSRKLQKLFA